MSKKWIQDAVKRPGRCTPFPNPDCMPGTPQYNLAKRFKSGEFKKKKCGGSVMFCGGEYHSPVKQAVGPNKIL